MVVLVAPAAEGQQFPLPGMLPGFGSVSGPAASPAPAATTIEVGQWVEYRFRRGRERPVTVRYALVEREPDGDWLETRYTRADGGRLLIRVLVEGRLDRPGRIKRVIVQEGHGQALELPAERGAGALPPQVPTSANARVVGEEAIQVAGHRLRARHVRASEGVGATDAWVSTAVPLWGLVRFSSSRYQLDLLGFGTGARSSLVGDPVRFDPSASGL